VYVGHWYCPDTYSHRISNLITLDVLGLVEFPSIAAIPYRRTDQTCVAESFEVQVEAVVCSLSGGLVPCAFMVEVVLYSVEVAPVEVVAHAREHQPDGLIIEGGLVADVLGKFDELGSCEQGMAVSDLGVEPPLEGLHPSLGDAALVGDERQPRVVGAGRVERVVEICLAGPGRVLAVAEASSGVEEVFEAQAAVAAGVAECLDVVVDLGGGGEGHGQSV